MWFKQASLQIIYLERSKCLSYFCFKELPKIEVLLSLWNMVFSPPEDNEEEGNSQFGPTIPEQSITSHLLAVMDLFLVYNKCFPHILDIPSSINFLADIEQMMGNEDDRETVALIQEKVLQLLIALDSFAFTPDKVNII
jgi:hypothetical protein